MGPLPWERSRDKATAKPANAEDRASDAAGRSELGTAKARSADHAACAGAESKEPAQTEPSRTPPTHTNARTHTRKRARAHTQIKPKDRRKKMKSEHYITTTWQINIKY